MNTSGIVGFACGDKAGLHSNEVISLIVSRKARETGMPVLTQTALIHIKADVEVTPVDEVPPKWAPTLRIARQAVRWAQAKGLTELLIVAAAPHMPRCERDLREAAKEIGLEIKITVSEEIDEVPYRAWFCPDSGQLWTRYWWLLCPREWVLLKMPFRLYKRIAA